VKHRAVNDHFQRPQRRTTGVAALRARPPRLQRTGEAEDDRSRSAPARRAPEKMRQRRETVEHPFGTVKARMGATHFLMKTLPRVASEMALHVLAYNLVS